MEDNELDSLFESLNPNVQKTGYVIFDVPSNHNYWILMPGGWWSTEDAYVRVN